jgi:hypothetical protein
MIVGGQRRAYTSAGAFLSYGFNSFASVVPASSDDLALPTGSFIPPQDGSIICSDRGADQGTCYEVSNGMKYGFTSADVFTGLGFSFANSASGDVSWMSAGPSLLNSTVLAHLPGTLVNNNGTVQLVGASGLLGIPDLSTFNSWGYSFSKVVPANAADKTMTQTGVMVARQPGQLSPSWTTTPTCTTNCGSPVVSGSVSATLSSDTPVAGTVVANTSQTVPGQTGADLAHFTFTGSGTVTQVVVNRIGVSSDNSLSNVYLYQGNNRITSAGSFSNGMVTFTNSNGLFTVSGSAEISLRVDVAAGATSGQTLGAQLSSFTVANGSPMSTSISGNLFQIAAVNNLATAQLSGTTVLNSGITSSGAANGVAGTINAGTNNSILWQAPINIGQRTVLLKHIAFTQIGSVQSSAITNLQLYVDGNAVGTAGTVTSVGGQSQVVFDFTGSPVSLNTGSHTVSLEGNIIGGTSFTFEYSIQTAADIVLYDTNYNVNVPLTYSGGGTVFQLNPGLTTINSGTVSVQSDPAFTATQFVSNSSQVTLGQWDLTAYGENVNVNQLKVTLAYTGTPQPNVEGFNNLSIFVNGGSVGSSQNAIASASSTSFTYTFGTTNLFTIQAGQTVTVQIKGDSVLNSNTAVTAVQASLVLPAQTIQGQTSYSLSPASQQTYTATTLTTGSSGATLAKNVAYSNQTVGSNQNNQEIGSYVIQSGSIDGLRLNQVTVGLGGTLNGGSVTTGLTSLSVNVVYPGGSASTTPVNPQTSNTFTLNNVTIPANQTATVNVFANIGNFTGTASTTMSGTGQGLTSNQAVTLSQQTGQTVTVGTGSLTSVNLSAAASPQTSFVAGGATNQPIATYNFYATSTASVNITELGFTVPVSGAINSVTVGGSVGTIVGTRALVTGLNINVPFGNTGLSVPVVVSYSKAGSNGVSDQTVQLTLSHVKYTSGSNTVSNSSNAYNTAAGTSDSNGVIGASGVNAPMVDLVGSYPSLTVASTNNGGLALNEQHLIDVTVSPNSAGNVQVNTIDFSVSSSGISSGTLSSERLAIGSNTISSSSCGISGTTTAQSITSGATVVCTLPANYSIQPTSPLTFTLYGTVGGTISGSSGSASVTTALSPASNFSWTDVTGDGSTFTGANSTYLVNYPSQSWYIHN